MTLLSILSIALAIPNFIFIVLSQLAFWQRKEYRLDRALSVLHDNFFTWRRFLLLIPLTFWLIGYFLSLPLLHLICLATIFALYLATAFTVGIFRPHWTKKAALLGALSFLCLAFYLIFIIINPTSLPLRFSALCLLLFPLIAILVGLVNLVTNQKKKSVIAQARSHRQQLDSLKVIGLTGSYGKTTTKHFLSQLISNSTVSQEHRNSEYIIAQDMLAQLNSQTKHYLVEMAAYQAGEIAALCRLTSPNIGVLTHIGNQHLSLFGSQEKITAAKWELIDSLPNHGIAVLNADDDLIQQQASKWSGDTYWYSTTKAADVYASNIRFKPQGTAFTLHIKHNTYPVTVPLISEAYLDSVIAAACTAHAAGVPDQVIISGLKQLQPLPRTMQLLKGPNNSLIIDDSYSANEQSVLNAIRHLQRFPQADRRVVMVPLIELGSASKTVHQRLGQLLRQTKLPAYVYGCAWHRQLQQPTYTNPRSLLKAISSNLSSDSVILLEGRIPETIRSSLIK